MATTLRRIIASSMLVALAVTFAACSGGQDADAPATVAGTTTSAQATTTAAAGAAPSFTTGPAKTTDPGLIDCGSGSRTSAVGEITSSDGKTWTVPAATNFTTGPKAPDLYNDCGSGTTRSGVSDLDLESVPVVDAGGTEEFAAYVFADNYFELYVNGTLIAVDPVPFTPFNSNVIRFKAARPLTIAIMGVDWEENLGLGSEAGRGSSYSPGDAGVVLHLQDASGTSVAVTDTSWKAQTFYTSPLADTGCLEATGNTRDSSACDTEAADDGSGYSAAHWPLPDGWSDADYDDSGWPSAVAFSNDTVGVDGKPAFTNFPEIFDADGADASFIWSSNLVLDNLVLLRKTIA